MANAQANTLTEYAPGASGDATPIATVSSPAFFNGTTGLAQDENGNLLVTNRFMNTIDRIAPNANGITLPQAVIQGPDTGLSYPHGIDIDAQGRIVVADEYPAAIEIFPADAADDAQPVATISGASTGLGSPEALAVVPPLSIRTARLPRATVGMLYTAKLSAALGTPPYHWRLTRGRLPAGLRLTRAGEIRGVARVRVRRRIRIQVSDVTRPQMRATATLALRTRCRQGRSGSRCGQGAVHTVRTTIRLLRCRGRRCVTVAAVPSRVLAGQVHVTLVRGHTVYGRGISIRRHHRERIDIRLSRPRTRQPQAATYLLRQRTRTRRLTLPLSLGATSPL